MRFAKRIEKLPPYLFAEIDKKIAQKKQEGVDVISLGIGDPDQPTPANVVEKMCEAVRDSANHRYPSYYGHPEFRKAIADWFPEFAIAGMVALLFVVFGIQALRTTIEESDDGVKEKSGHGIFFTTFLLITVAEFGDKTQLAVVALSSTSSPVGVWLGSTLALGTTSTIGVLAGRKLLQKIPLELLHKIGGILFLMLASVAAVKSYRSYFGM